MLERQYRVVAVSGTATVSLLSDAPPGSPKRTVFDGTMRGRREAFAKSVPDAVDNVLMKEPATSAVFDSELWAESDKRIVSLKLTGT